jgi:hypothetical protein
MDVIRNAQKNGVVVGLKGVSLNGPVERMEVDDLLFKRPDTFNLFLLALDELQNDKHTNDIMGFYQVAGNPGAMLLCHFNGTKRLLQVFMVSRAPSGMAIRIRTRLLDLHGQAKATVRTAGLPFLHGIARIWP